MARNRLSTLEIPLSWDYVVVEGEEKGGGHDGRLSSHPANLRTAKWKLAPKFAPLDRYNFGRFYRFYRHYDVVTS